MIEEPLYKLTRCDVPQKRGSEQQISLDKIKFMLSQYVYNIEDRKTLNHGNADALIRLPSGPDPDFHGEEMDTDTALICNIKTISRQVDPSDPSVVSKATSRDDLLRSVI